MQTNQVNIKNTNQDFSYRKLTNKQLINYFIEKHTGKNGNGTKTATTEKETGEAQRANSMHQMSSPLRFKNVHSLVPELQTIAETTKATGGKTATVAGAESEQSSESSNSSDGEYIVIESGSDEPNKPSIQVFVNAETRSRAKIGGMPPTTANAQSCRCTWPKTCSNQRR